MAPCTTNAISGAASGALPSAQPGCQSQSQVRKLENAVDTVIGSRLGYWTTTMRMRLRNRLDKSQRLLMSSSSTSCPTRRCSSSVRSVGKTCQAEVARSATGGRSRCRGADVRRTSLHGNWRCHPGRSSPSSASSSSAYLSFHQSLAPSFTKAFGVSKSDLNNWDARTNRQQKQAGNKMTVRAARIKFSSSLAVDIPIREHPEVSFDQYIVNRPRVFHAMFPDRSRSQRLDEETWRIFMLPITFIFLSARPIVDMRIWNQHPSTFDMALARKSGMVNGRATKTAQSLCLQATRCRLEGLDFIMKPSDFILSVHGVLFADRSLGQTRLKGSVSLSVDLGSIPAAIAATPQPLIEGVGDLLVKQLLETMKTKVNERLIQDYTSYAREKTQTIARVGSQRT